MEVRTLLKRGTDHPLNCEDDLFTFNDGSTYIGAVFDGCSTGVKSHFASALYGKILKEICGSLRGSLGKDVSLVSPSYLGKFIYGALFTQLNHFKDRLSLDTLEILSTMILVVIHDGKAYVLVSGDGCVYSDGEEVKIESPGNAPDYLAYHLNNAIDGFLSLKEYTFDFENTVSVCSDGIYSFTDENKKDVSSYIVTNLLLDTAIIKSEAMLGRKYNLLLKEGYSNYDDLSIVRFIV